MTERIDARDLLAGLTGQLIHTLTGAPNRFQRVEATAVTVARGQVPCRPTRPDRVARGRA